MLAGEMDFTPGGFLNETPEQFTVVGGDSPAPRVMGTRCFQLAMMVVYESAFQVFCESPYNVRNQPGSDFLRGIPASWDETYVLAGMPGEYIVVARRSGNTWYVGGMSVKKRTLEINADFLGKIPYRMTLWSDAPDSDRHPGKVVRKEGATGRKAVIRVETAPGGGFVARFTPD
jgi:alpha-glucosidase